MVVTIPFVAREQQRCSFNDDTLTIDFLEKNVSVFKRVFDAPKYRAIISGFQVFQTLITTPRSIYLRRKSSRTHRSGNQLRLYYEK